MRSFVLLACGTVLCCLAAERNPPQARGQQASIEISALLYSERKEIQKLLGNDLQGYYTVVEVLITPKGGQPIPLQRDDFTLRSYKDGQRSPALHPSQVAGAAALVVSSKGSGGLRAESAGPVWGPPTGGPPVRIGGQDASIGNTSASGAEATTASRGGNASLLETLVARELPWGEISAPTRGLLYFLLEGKHKPKDLELVYTGPGGKLSLKFK